MKEFKGTESEWKIQEPYNTFVYGPGGKLICQMKYAPFSEEATANAMIIAAAPELLEALQELHDLLEDNLPEWYLKGHHNRAEKAINKALGL